jgi:hypothetical protein
MTLKACQICNFGKSGVMNDSAVGKLLKKLPPIHVANPPLQSISYIDEVHYIYPHHRRFEKALILGECNIIEEQKVGLITIYRQQEDGNNDERDFITTIYHEIGHTAFELILSEKQRVEWFGLCAKQQVFSWNRAGANPLEHFCDNYAYYVVNGKMEKTFFSEYEFMKKNVFDVGGAQ